MEFQEVDVTDEVPDLASEASHRDFSGPITGATLAVAESKMNIRTFDDMGSNNWVGHVHAGAVKCDLVEQTQYEPGSPRFDVTFAEYRGVPCSGQYYSPILLPMNKKRTRTHPEKYLALPLHLINVLSGRRAMPYLPMTSVES